MQLTADQALQLAIAHQQGGRAADAEVICQQILAADPDHAGALHLLGVIATQTGRGERGVELLRRAVELSPEHSEYQYNLGLLLHQQGDLNAAIECYQWALAIKPSLVEAHYNLGNALKKKGELDKAIACYREALHIKPNHSAAHNNLGNALRDKGQVDEAIESYRRALALRPDYPEALYNLANTLRDLGQPDAAIESYRRAIELKPDYPEALHNMGIAFWKKAELDQAIDCYRRAIQLKQQYAEAHYSLGIALRDKSRPGEAIVSYRKALEIRPGYCEAYNNLAGILWEQGELDEALACYRRAMEADPDFISAHDNLLYALPFHPASTKETIFAESQRWNVQHARRFQPTAARYGNDRNPNRRLRIGYVSPDFRRHPVGRSLLPVMRQHDRARVELVCYASTVKPDDLTPRFMEQASLWRDARELSDEQLAAQSRDDGIDILVDLTLHMSGSRLLVFARKPAPVQVTWLGYPGTTGLETIDYRLTDPYMDPPGGTDEYYSETSLRLPETFQCYDPLMEDMPIGAPPAVRAGHITFGCLNNFAKINRPLLESWGKILKEVAGARLLLKATAPTARKWALDIFQENRISSDRIEFAGDQPSHEAYMSLYHRMDLALDPFPYNGHTTSMDAMWMGVPVVSRCGPTAVSRAGLSQSSNLGLPELTADSEAGFIRAAVSLAGNLPRLAELRGTLRERMKASPLMDAERLARGLEEAYQKMWRNWCAE